MPASGLALIYIEQTRGEGNKMYKEKEPRWGWGLSFGVSLPSRLEGVRSFVY